MNGRVLEATFAFWAIAILSDPVGGALGELIAGAWGSAATAIVGALLALALAVQFLTRRCNPWLASTALLLIGAFAALAIDDLLVAGATSGAVTAACGVLLGATLAVWFMRDRTLWVDDVRTRPGEALYWLAVLLAFALGSALDRLVTDALGLKPVLSTALFAAVIGVIAVARIMFDVNRALCFWIALVLTRPLGAALGDLFAFSPGTGGLGAGRPVTSILFLVAIAVAVIAAAVSLRRRRTGASAGTSAARPPSSS